MQNNRSSFCSSFAHVGFESFLPEVQSACAVITARTAQGHLMLRDINIHSTSMSGHAFQGRPQNAELACVQGVESGLTLICMIAAKCASACWAHGVAPLGTPPIQLFFR